MAVDALSWFIFAGAALELVLGLWVYWAAPRSGVNRGFAFFLVATALGDAAQGFAPTGALAATGQALTRFQQAVFDAGSAAYMLSSIGLAWLALSYPGERPMTGGERRTFAALATLSSIGLLSGVFAPNDGWLDKADDALQTAILAGQGLAAAWIARHLGRGDRRRQESTRLIVLGLSFWPLWAATLNVLALAGIGSNPFGVALGVRIAFVFGGVALWAAWRLARRTPQGQIRWGQLSLLGLAVALGVVTELVPGAGPPTYLGTILAMVLFVAYGILRYNLFAIDRRVRFAISKSTVAAIFIAVFFIASEAAQQFFGDRTGSTYFGIAIAGTLVFAMAPIQRVAERFATKAVPVAPTEPPSQPASRIEQTYRDALAVAMRDRKLTPAEEVTLARLAEDLGIGAGRAMEIRHEAEASQVRPKERRD